MLINSRQPKQGSQASRMDANAGTNVIRSHRSGRDTARRILFRMQRRTLIVQREALV